MENDKFINDLRVAFDKFYEEKIIISHVLIGDEMWTRVIIKGDRDV